MTVNRESLEKLGRFLLRGLRLGASTVSIVAGVSAGGTAAAAPQLRA
jgi:uncharacterized protein (DUF2062 family)